MFVTYKTINLLLIYADINFVITLYMDIYYYYTFVINYRQVSIIYTFELDRLVTIY